MQFSYRSSLLKREKRSAIILSALFKAQHSTREAAWKILSDNAEQRRQTQPRATQPAPLSRIPLVITLAG